MRKLSTNDPKNSGQRKTLAQERKDRAIVVVEPNKQMQNLIRTMLTGFGCRRVRIFSEVDSAVESMLGDMPSVLLLDWEAPPYGGRNVLKLLRHQKMFPLCLTPIISMFSIARQREVEGAMRLGAQAALVKPIAPDVLMQHMDYVCLSDSPLKLVGERYVVNGMAEQLDDDLARRKQLAAARQYQMEQLDALSSLQDDVDRILGTAF